MSTASPDPGTAPSGSAAAAGGAVAAARHGPDEILSRFMSFVAASGLELYAAQEEALLELMADKHVVLNTPTGSGKSLVATALHFKALARGGRRSTPAPSRRW
jgi:superfamily II RNA helicase